MIDLERETAAPVGSKDGGSKDKVKALAGKTFETESTTRVASRQVKFGDLALEALPWLHLGASLLVLLWAALGLVLGGRA